MSETVQKKIYELYDFYDWYTPNGPKTKLHAMAVDMSYFMLNYTEFGSYCHEGGDLVQDYLTFSGIALSSLGNGEYRRLEYLSHEVIDISEGNECDECNPRNYEGMADE